MVEVVQIPDLTPQETIALLRAQLLEHRKVVETQLEKIADLGAALCDEHDRLREALADRDRARAIAVALEQELAQGRHNPAPIDALKEGK